MTICDEVSPGRLQLWPLVNPRWGTPYVSIQVQGVLSSVLLLLMHLGETLRAVYQILVDLTVIPIFFPFVYIFASGFKFGQRIAGTAGFSNAVGHRAVGRTAARYRLRVGFATGSGGLADFRTQPAERLDW